MRNTLALGIVLLGCVLMVASVKNWKTTTAIQVLTGQKPWDTPADGGGPTGTSGGTIPGRATASEKDRPGYLDSQLEKNPDGSWKRDDNGYIVIKPGEEGNPKVGKSVPQKGTLDPKNLQTNADVRNKMAQF